MKLIFLKELLQRLSDDILRLESELLVLGKFFVVNLDQGVDKKWRNGDVILSLDSMNIRIGVAVDEFAVHRGLVWWAEQYSSEVSFCVEPSQDERMLFIDGWSSILLTELLDDRVERILSVQKVLKILLIIGVNIEPHHPVLIQLELSWPLKRQNPISFIKMIIGQEVLALIVILNLLGKSIDQRFVKHLSVVL